MSAFIVGRDHIDAMVGAGFKGRHGPLHWCWGTDRYNISHNVLTNESEAYAYCEALRKEMIAMLPGYEDAQWEIRVA